MRESKLLDVTSGGKEAEIEAFVTRFLTSFGAEVARGNDHLTADLPPDVAALLGSASRLDLTFSPSVGMPPAREYVTFGHPLLDRMLSLARERGLTSNLMFTFGMAPEFVERVAQIDPFQSKQVRSGETAEEAETSNRLIDELLRQARKISIENARVRVTERRIFHQRQVLFFFKVSLISDDKWETTLALLVDPLTEEVDRPVDVTEAVSFSPQLRDDPGDTRVEYALDRLYRKACEHLKVRLQSRMREFEEGVSARVSRETRRIEEYYRGLAGESVEPLRKLFRRISAAGVQAELARSWHSQVKYQERVQLLRQEARELEEAYRQAALGLQEEKEQRLREVREKYRPRVEITLTHAAYVMVPRVEWQVRLVRPHLSRESTLVYDLLRRSFVDWKCEHCEERLVGKAYLCSCETLVCESCYAPCSGCDGDSCLACARGTCHLCQGSVCGICDADCPAGAHMPTPERIELPMICASCRREWCEECQASALHFGN